MGYPLSNARLQPMPEIEGPVEQQTRLLGLRDLMQRGQMQQMQLQEARQQMQDSQTVQAVLGQTQGDMEKALPILSGKVSPQMYHVLVNSHLDAQKAMRQKTLDELQIEAVKNDRLFTLANQVAQLPDDQYVQQWPAIAAQANQLHEGLNLDPSQPIPKDKIAGITLGLATQKNYIDRETQAKEAAQRQGSEIDRKLKEQELAVSPEFIKRKRAGERPTTAIQDYEYAVAQGYKGTFEQWQKQQANLRPQTVTIQTVNAEGQPVTAIVPKRAGAEYATNKLSPDVSRASTDAMTAKTAYDAALQDAKDKTARGDLAIIFHTVRSMVAGAGRMTQTEIAAEAKAGSYGQRIQRWYTMAASGTLPDDQRAQMVEVIKNAYEAKARNAKELWQSRHPDIALPPHLAAVGGGAATPTTGTPSPKSHVFSASAWKAANPSGNVEAAKAAAKAQGYEVRD